MVALTDVAFPGYFRAKTHRMGSYFGVRVEGKLVANRGDGLRSWLHVGAQNSRAVDLYTALGFECVRTLMLHRIVRAH